LSPGPVTAVTGPAAVTGKRVLHAAPSKVSAVEPKALT